MAYGQYNIWIIKARKHTHAHTLAAHRALTQALNGIVQPSVFKSTDFGVLNGCIYIAKRRQCQHTYRRSVQMFESFAMCCLTNAGHIRPCCINNQTKFGSVPYDIDTYIWFGACVCTSNGSYGSAVLVIFCASKVE